MTAYADIIAVFGGLALLITAYRVWQYLRWMRSARQYRDRLRTVLKARDLL